VTAVAEAAELEQRFRHLERCRVCSAALPDSRVCDRCGTAKSTPRHENWPRSLKIFLIVKYAERLLFFKWRPLQSSWELLLSGYYDAQRKAGEVVPRSTSPDDLYQRAVNDAEEWNVSGAETTFL
jgi:predicted amidophosphoribosyltransferase